MFGGGVDSDESALNAGNMPPLVASLTPSVWPPGGRHFGIAGVSSRELAQRRFAGGRRSASAAEQHRHSLDGAAVRLSLLSVDDDGRHGASGTEPAERVYGGPGAILGRGSKRRPITPSRALSPASPLPGADSLWETYAQFGQQGKAAGAAGGGTQTQVGSARTGSDGGPEGGAAGNVYRSRDYVGSKKTFGGGCNDSSGARAFLDHSGNGNKNDGGGKAAAGARGYNLDEDPAFDGAAGAPTRVLALGDMRDQLLSAKVSSAAAGRQHPLSSAETAALLGGTPTQPPPSPRARRPSGTAGVAGATSAEMARYERRQLGADGAPPRSPLGRAALVTADAVMAGMAPPSHEEAEPARGRHRPTGTRADTLKLGDGGDGGGARSPAERPRRLRKAPPDQPVEGGAGLDSAAVHAARARHGPAHAARNAATHADASLGGVTGGEWLAEPEPRARAPSPADALRAARNSPTAGLGSAAVHVAAARRPKPAQGAKGGSGELSTFADLAGGVDGSDGGADTASAGARQPPRAEPATLPVAGAASGARARRPRGRRREAEIVAAIVREEEAEEAELEARYEEWRRTGVGLVGFGQGDGEWGGPGDTSARRERRGSFRGGGGSYRGNGGSYRGDGESTYMGDGGSADDGYTDDEGYTDDDSYTDDGAYSERGGYADDDNDDGAGSSRSSRAGGGHLSARGENGRRLSFREESPRERRRPPAVSVQSPRSAHAAAAERARRVGNLVASADTLAHAPPPSPPSPHGSGARPSALPAGRGFGFSPLVAGEAVPRDAARAHARGTSSTVGNGHGSGDGARDGPANRSRGHGVSASRRDSAGGAAGARIGSPRASSDGGSMRGGARPRSPMISVVPPSEAGGCSTGSGRRRAADLRLSSDGVQRTAAQVDRLRSANARAAAALVRVSRDGGVLSGA